MKQIKSSIAIFLYIGLILLQSCTNEFPEMTMPDGVHEDNTTFLNINEKDIISTAINGYQRFYGDSNSDSRSVETQSCVLPLNIIPVGRLSSRNTGATPLLYVVNFEDNRGFAVVSTAQSGEKLLAVSDTGSYDDNLLNEVPGLGLWMDNALAYAESNEIITQDATLEPTFPTNPIDERLQNKEWNDTTSHVYVSPQLHIAWGQGHGNVTYINNQNCEGFYFPNGVCGCGTLAIAQICAGLEYPSTLNEIYPGVGTRHSFDWTAITKHKAKRINILTGEESENGICSESNKAQTHESIARLCRIIGDYGQAKPDGNQTAMTAPNILNAASLIFGYNNVSCWQKLSMNIHFPKGTFAIVIGESKYEGESAHAWICDGADHIYFTHYFATRKSDLQPWTIQSSAKGESHYLHFNWGWDGIGNGWFYTIEPEVKEYTNTGYTNLQYITIRH